MGLFPGPDWGSLQHSARPQARLIENGHFAAWGGVESPFESLAAGLY